jgi:REP element-mobilizing transposase RayT
MLLVDVLRSYRTAGKRTANAWCALGKFRIHDFVVMPNHLHVLLTVGRDMTIEKAMQLIKGGFS